MFYDSETTSHEQSCVFNICIGIHHALMHDPKPGECVLEYKSLAPWLSTYRVNLPYCGRFHYMVDKMSSFISVIILLLYAKILFFKYYDKT